MQTSPNVDSDTVSGFGSEWKNFDQSSLSTLELNELFQEYFKIFPRSVLNSQSVGADFGCGSGRWSRFLTSSVKELHLVDASEEAIAVAKRNLSDATNVSFHHSSIENAKIPRGSLDFAFSLGVLHHIPETDRALRDIASFLKPGAAFLIYLYYSLDHRPLWYRLLWKASNLARFAISRLPFGLRNKVCFLIACTCYWPLARTARLLEKAHIFPTYFPLKYYRNRSFYIMRNDALDRFGTKLEKRFSQSEIRTLLESNGFENITFSTEAPFWCAVCYRKSPWPKGNS